MREADELTEAERQLEQALKSLRPAAARIDPLLAELAARRRANQRRLRLRQVAAAAAILAAIGVWAAFGLRGERSPLAAAPDVAGLRPDAMAADAVVAPPTVLAYRRALARSAAALEALLDQHSESGRSSAHTIVPAGVRPLWGVNFPSPLGAL